MRLNKYIAHSGVCSRRKADELIQQGEVTVNGLQAECGYDVTEGDVVSVAGRTITPEKRLVYYILNKPGGIHHYLGGRTGTADGTRSDAGYQRENLSRREVGFQYVRHADHDQ